MRSFSWFLGLTLAIGVFDLSKATDGHVDPLKSSEAPPKTDIVIRASSGKLVWFFKNPDGTYTLRECDAQFQNDIKKCPPDPQNDKVIPSYTFESAYMGQLLFRNSLNDLSTDDSANLAGTLGRDLAAEKADFERDLKTIEGLIRKFNDPADKEQLAKIKKDLEQLKKIVRSQEKLEYLKQKRDEFIAAHAKTILERIQSEKVYFHSQNKGEKIEQASAEILDELYMRPPVPCGNLEAVSMEESINDQMADCVSKVGAKASKIEFNGQEWNLVRVTPRGEFWWKNKQTGIVWMEPSQDKFRYGEKDCPEGWGFPTSTQIAQATKAGLRDVFPVLQRGEYTWIAPSEKDKWKGGSQAYFTGAGTSKRTLKDPEIVQADPKRANWARQMCVKKI
jgi:hypothetical protein